MKIGVVIPSNRPVELESFKAAWKERIEEAEAKLYVVEDVEGTWASIRADLGHDSWIIPVRTDCIRSYGYLRALRDGCDYVVTLDDDVRPIEGENAIIEHINQLQRLVEPDHWTRTLRTPGSPPTRGLPLTRRVVVNHGLWLGMADVSAKTQLEGLGQYNTPGWENEMIVPKGVFYPMSGMNLSFAKGMIPFMYFGLQGADIRDPTVRWGVDRCGDIFAGITSKIIVDALSEAIHSGSPYINHNRASHPIKNLELEASSVGLSHTFSFSLVGSESYGEMASRIYNLGYPSRRYCRDLANAMRKWMEVVKKG